MKSLAPIALFAYQRPHHLRRVLSALRDNSLASESELVVFADGPRAASDQAGVKAVRQVIQAIEGFKAVTLVQSSFNLGLAASLVRGLDYMLHQWDRVIVLEDDILVGQHFLQYMNEHLDLYQHDESVASIHGYVYPHQDERLNKTFFIRGADCWGWGTWRRAWAVYNPDGANLLSELRKRGLVDSFNFEGSAPYEEMLIDQVNGRNNSWAVRWYASAFLRGMFTLYPNEPMAINIGEDGSGFHQGSSSVYSQRLSHSPVAVNRVVVAESAEGREAFRQFFRTRYRIPSSKLGRWAWQRARRVKNRIPR